LQAKDFKPEVAPDWCAGCGDFGVLNALFQACAEIDLPPREMLVVSGIGCSSNLPGFIRAYGVHSLHGRALPFATGAKLANRAMTVIATGGDGDGYGIGLNHFIQAMRRNIDLTYIVMNNEIYGLTTGQVSPTSGTGMKTKTTPHGNLDQMLNPIPQCDGQASRVGREDSDRPFLSQSEPAAEPRRAGPGLQSGVLVRQPLGMSEEQRRKCIEEFM